MEQQWTNTITNRRKPQQKEATAVGKMHQHTQHSQWSSLWPRKAPIIFTCFSTTWLFFFSLTSTTQGNLHQICSISEEENYNISETANRRRPAALLFSVEDQNEMVCVLIEKVIPYDIIFLTKCICYCKLVVYNVIFGETQLLSYSFLVTLMNSATLLWHHGVKITVSRTDS